MSADWKKLEPLFATVRRHVACACRARTEEECECGAAAARAAMDALERRMRAQLDVADVDVAPSAVDEVAF